MLGKTKAAQVVASASSCDRKRWQGQSDFRSVFDGDRVSCFAPLTGNNLLHPPVPPKVPCSRLVYSSCLLLSNCPLPRWLGSIVLVSILRNYSHTSKISRRSWFRPITIEIIFPPSLIPSLRRMSSVHTPFLTSLWIFLLAVLYIFRSCGLELTHTIASYSPSATEGMRYCSVKRDETGFNLHESTVTMKHIS
ncbi:hypothetical protein BJV78DRAFT_907622 [Lactifluus subvellereus]|nr:hypothetical protein BJV78DRAFT_907622 [Lactifluus subvellereus]